MQQIQITRPTHPDWSSERLELHETSFHEAGHAVLAALAGTYELGEIDARIGGGAFGTIQLRLPWTSAQRT